MKLIMNKNLTSNEKIMLFYLSMKRKSTKVDHGLTALELRITRQTVAKSINKLEDYKFLKIYKIGLFQHFKITKKGKLDLGLK